MVSPLITPRYAEDARRLAEYVRLSKEAEIPNGEPSCYAKSGGVICVLLRHKGPHVASDTNDKIYRV